MLTVGGQGLLGFVPYSSTGSIGIIRGSCGRGGTKEKETGRGCCRKSGMPRDYGG